MNANKCDLLEWYFTARKKPFQIEWDFTNRVSENETLHWNLFNSNDGRVSQTANEVNTCEKLLYYYEQVAFGNNFFWFYGPMQHMPSLSVSRFISCVFWVDAKSLYLRTLVEIPIFKKRRSRDKRKRRIQYVKFLLYKWAFLCFRFRKKNSGI